MCFEIGSGALWLLRTVWTAFVFLIAAAARLLSVQPPIVVAVTAGIGTIGWWYAARWSRSLQCSVDRHAVCVRYGVLWRCEALIPLSALRAVEVWTPPLHRAFRCRTVVLRFAGGAVCIPLLSSADAKRLCGFLESAKGER